MDGSLHELMGPVRLWSNSGVPEHDVHSVLRSANR